MIETVVSDEFWWRKRVRIPKSHGSRCKVSGLSISGESLWGLETQCVSGSVLILYELRDTSQFIHKFGNLHRAYARSSCGPIPNFLDLHLTRCQVPTSTHFRGAMRW